jgi:predicted ATPase
LGNALMAARGQGAPETKAIFERVQVLAAGDADIVKRSLAYFGVWAGHYVRGDLGAMREQVDIFLRDVADHPNPSMEGLANRICGGTHWFAGDFATAGIYLDKALALFDPGRDPALLYQFSHDFGTSAMIQAAMARWPLGEVDRARRHADEMLARLEQVPHSGTAALANTYAAVFELIRRDPARTAPRAAAVASLARTHEMAQWKAYGQYFEGWAEWRSGAKDVGLSAMRSGIALLREQKVVAFDPLMKAVVAEAEADRDEFDAAFVVLNEALAGSERTGQRWFDAELHRIHGEILLKQNPANTGPVEDAFLTALAISQCQKARSFELRAALSLAKLYRAMGRDADAHAVLARALNGFAPTPEFPEIAEALEMLPTLEASARS